MNGCNTAAATVRINRSGPRQKWRLTLTLLLALLVAGPVLGQVPRGSQQIPSIDQQPAARSPLQQFEAPALPPVLPGRSNVTPINEGEVPEGITVAVSRIDIVPSDLRAELLPFTAGLTGPSISVRQLNDARQQIVLYLRGRNRPLTTVSLDIDQDTHVVRYLVVEGHIADVVVAGEPERAVAMVRRFLYQLKGQAAIDNATLERYLLLAQDIPGITVTTALVPSTIDRGALTLLAQVSLQTISGQILFDNRAFALTGPIEGLAAVDLNGVTSWGDKTELSFYHTFPNSQNFGQISSEWFFGWDGLSDGLKMKIYGGAGASVPTGSLAALHYIGTTNIFGTSLSYPWIRSRQENLNVSVALDALESTIDTGVPSAQASSDEVRTLRLAEDYNRSDNLLGRLWDSIGGGKTANTSLPATDELTTRLSRGLDFLGGFHGTALPPSTARQGEQHNFTAISFEASRTQTLYVTAQGTSIGLKVLVTGQWSPNILPPAEQFYLGGSRFTRGFYSGQVPGDKALAITAELQFNSVPAVTFFDTRMEIPTQFYLFYDWGESWQNLSSDFAARLASAGGGVRLQVTNNVEVDLEALGRITIHPPPATADMNGIGLYWRVLKRF